MILFISTSEILFILFVTVLIFGTDKIPDIARTLGKGMRQIRDATNDVKDEINRSAHNIGVDTNPVSDIKNEVNKVKEELEDAMGRVKRKN